MGTGSLPVPTTRSSSVTEPTHNWRRRLLAIVATLAVLATACGGGSGDGPASQQSTAAIAAAAENSAQLELSSDLAVSQLLDTRDGSIISLGDVITGDRAVLLWYWAPH